MLITDGISLVRRRIGQIDFQPISGYGRGKVRRSQSGYIPESFRMGNKGIIPDDWLEVLAQGFVLLDEINGQASGFQ